MTDDLTAQCEHDDDIDRAWVDRGKSRRVRRKQARKPKKNAAGCQCDWCHPPERPGNQRRRIAAQEQIAEASPDAVAATATADQEHADDKRQLNEWSDYYRQTAALAD